MVSPVEDIQDNGQIAEAGCRTRKDSVRVVEALVTASPEFFKGKSRAEVKVYFQHALDFIREHQDPETILSAVVHMDEKTPHMHLSFVPLTEDGRLSAKDIVGNRKKLIWWQDEFWNHMVRKYPELERGESASQTGREHIPPQLYKQMTRLLKQRRKIQETIESITPLNNRAKSKELCVLLDRYLPAVTKMRSELDIYRQSFDDLRTENAGLKEANAVLTEQGRESVLRQMQVLKMERDDAQVVEILDRIPQEALEQYAPEQPAERRKHNERE
ncbi:MAG: plasmid recombination protein [Clostridiales bacterium]|nr:plasmid recombination protein [Clostridiales bacterium]